MAGPHVISSKLTLTEQFNLLVCVQTNDFSSIKEYIRDHRINLDEPLCNGQTLLVQAILYSNVELVRYLLIRGANLSIPGRTVGCEAPTRDDVILTYPLQAALDIRNAELVLVLLQYGSKPLWHCSRDLKWLLSFAVERNHLELLEWLLTYVKENREEEKCILAAHALLEAVKHSSITLTGFVLNEGACPSRLCYGTLPLVAAAENEDFKMCEFLIERGANLGDSKESSAFSDCPNPLTIAISTSSQKAVSYLVRKGCRVNVIAYWNAYDTLSKRCLVPQSTMLHFAIFKRSLVIAELLIKAGSSVNDKDSEGNTPLHLASQDSLGPTDLVQFLLRFAGNKRKNVQWRDAIGDSFTKESGQIVNLNAKNRSGQTPLITAVVCNNLKAVKLLLYAKAEINTKDNGQSSALHHAVRVKSDDIVWHLTQNVNCRIDLADGAGFSALHLAVLNGSWTITDILLNAGANHKRRTYSGETLLHQAVRSKNESLVELFLDVGLDIDARAKCGETALMLAARSDSRICKLLVKRGANLNMKDRNQEETALSQSVYFGHEENARLLIREGADVNLCDKRDTTPLYWSIFNARFHTLTLLILAGAKLTFGQFESQYPRNLTVKRNVIVTEWIRRYTSEVRRLQDLCRRCIRQKLTVRTGGRGIVDLIDMLMLPQRLKKYLSFKLIDEIPQFSDTIPGD